MEPGNGDLVREATMGRVRSHVRAAMLTGCDPDDLVAEVVRTYDLNRVEAGMAEIMVRYYGSLASRGKSRRATSGRSDRGEM
jgi:hypothetical protein